MDILSKFEAVTVKADIRLSEADQRFCEAHEAAYHTAQTCFQEMEYIWEDICGRQKDILLEVDSMRPIYQPAAALIFLPSRSVST